jgi:hypothetical protein
MFLNGMTVDEVIELADKYYKSPEGRKQLEKTWQTCQEASNQIRKETQITPELLNMWINI